MAPFGENFRGNREFVICPLCQKHLDNQSMSFQCEVLKDKMKIECSLTDIHSDSVTIKTAKTVLEMLKIREKILEKKNSETAKD